MKTLERLQVILSLNDRMSKGLGGVLKKFNKFQRGMARGAQQMRNGFTAALTGIGGLLASILPGLEQSRARAVLATLGVDEDALNRVGDVAAKMASKFGLSATAVVQGAYDIQSAIAGLTGRELAAFTEVSATLAKGTKSSTPVITNYLGTLYGIFTKQAERLGKAAWVKMAAGMTAQSVEMFKTNGGEISQAFSTLGADATAAGLSMSEQFAVLGRLSATMKGGEAGTKFKAVLRGIGMAQKTLGLGFTDSEGRMLPMVEILGKLKGRFGEIDTVAKADLLKKAFGSDEAVAALKLLIGQTGQLRGNIQSLEKAKGLQKAAEMARKATVPFDRLTGAVSSTAQTFSMILLNALKPLIDWGTEFFGTLQRLAKQFPHITAMVAILTIGVFAFITALGVLMMAMAGLKMVMAGFALIAGVLSWPLVLIGLLIAGVMAVVYWWDELKARLIVIADWFESLPGPIQAIVAAMLPFIIIPALMAKHWETVKKVMLVVWEVIKKVGAALYDLFIKPFVDAIALLGKFVGGGLAKFLKLDVLFKGLVDPEEVAATNGGLAASANQTQSVPGLVAMAANAANSSTDNSNRMYVERVVIHPKEKMEPDSFRRMLYAEAR